MSYAYSSLRKKEAFFQIYMKSISSIFIFLLLIGLNSCKKEKEPDQNLLIGKEWVYNSFETKTGSENWISMPVQLYFPCVIGATLRFTDDHIVIPTQGSEECTDLDELDFLSYSTWELTEDGKNLVVNGDVRLNIEVLNKNKLVLTVIDPDQPDVLNRISFKR